MYLTKKQQDLVTLSALEAKGNVDKLSVALDEALDSEMTINEAKEEFSHLYAYTGFPRALNALTTLQHVVADRKKKGKVCIEDEVFTLSPDFDALKQGTAIQTKLQGGEPFDYSFEPRIDYYLKAHLFGDIFANPILSPLEREVVTVSALSALEGCGSQLMSHVVDCQNFGITLLQLSEMAEVLEVKAGNMESYCLCKTLAEAQNYDSKEEQPMDFDIWPKGDPKTEYAQYFISESYLAGLDQIQATSGLNQFPTKFTSFSDRDN